MIDLHCHSHFSDGELSPDSLLKKALDARVRVLALTDHDTTAGIMPLREAAAGCDITIIDGIELSSRWKKYDIHVIGLGIKPNDAQLLALIATQNTNRIARAHAIASRLQASGVNDAYQKACNIAGHERVGRPHFAKVLVCEGKVSDIKAAFKQYLGRGRSAYVPTPWLPIEESVAGIVRSGGQAVIAHPLKYDLTRTKLYELIRVFKEAGGVGIEVVSGQATAHEIQELSGICQRFDLLASTGSDYHGDTLSRMGLGRQQPLPNNCLPIWQEWNIREYLTGGL